jgi:hypothetical protein
LRFFSDKNELFQYVIVSPRMFLKPPTHAGATERAETMREKRNEERRWRKVYRDAVLFVAAMPLVAGCSGYPGSSSYLAPFYDAAPPMGRMAFRPNQVLAPAPQRTAPVAQEGNSGIGGELLAGAGGFIAGQMLKPESVAAAGAGEAEAAAAATGAAAGRVIAGEALAGESAAAAVTAGEAAAGAEAIAAGEAAAGVEALGAGEVLGAGAAAGAGEILLGAAVIAGSVYLGYQIYKSYTESRK